MSFIKLNRRVIDMSEKELLESKKEVEHILLLINESLERYKE